MLAAGFFCMLSTVNGRAGEPAPAVGDSPPAEAEESPAPNPALERIRREMDANIDKVMRAYLMEQPEGRMRADVGAILGAFQELGRFSSPDARRALEYYRAAARLGSAEADCALGNFYQNGVDDERGKIERKPALARECYERAAAGGSVRAMLELGAIYAEGKDVGPDSKKALGYFMSAAKRANEAALARLEPVMAKAREWEAAHPGKPAGFPTSRENIIDPKLVQEFIDVNFEMEKLASHVYVELSKRLAAAMKK